MLKIGDVSKIEMDKFKKILVLQIPLFNFCLILFSIHSLTAQTNPNLLAGDKYFNNFEYYLAAKKYAKVAKKDSTNSYALYQLAECYRYYNDYKSAEATYYNVFLKYKSAYPLAHYWYASLLKDNGKYLKALHHFERFRNETTSTNLEIEIYRERALKDIKGCYIIMDEVSKAKSKYSLTCLPAPLNSEDSDFSPVIYGNDSCLVVTSTRKGASGKIKNTISGGALSDFYIYKKINKTFWVENSTNETNLSKLNTPYNECGGSFTKDGKKYYFTKCDVSIKKENLEDVTCAIYVSYLKDGLWSNPVLLNKNINYEGYWNGQPSISPNGNILFFVSKRPGGIGMHDIWYSTCNNDDLWGEAINLGDKVNTLFSDVSPQYYADQKVLFFSSNGHGGLGGLDIFLTKEDDHFENIINIGSPFNTQRDDFYFVLGDKKGFISSNRQGGIGNDDIYTFAIKSKKNVIQFIEDSIDRPDEHPNFQLAENSKPITNKAVIAAIDPNQFSNAKSITVDGKILLEDSKKPVEDLSILLVDNNGNTLKTTKTDKNGYYKFSNLDGGNNYSLIFQETSLAEQFKDKNFIAEKINVKGSSATPSKQFFENIFFDFDSYELRSEAKKVLDDLVAFCKNDSLIQLELYCNTDSYGTSLYNKSLAEKRGKAAMDYLKKQGLTQSSMVINAVGENKAIATNDTEIGRQLNRRIEFYVLGTSSLLYNKTTFIIESNKTTYSVAKEYNMTEEELIELNGLTTTEIKAFTPVRIKKKIEVNELGEPNTHMSEKIVLPETEYTESDEKGILKNQEINKNFNFKNPEYLHYLDSIENKQKYIVAENEHVDFYIVQPTNTLMGIAQLYGINFEELKKLNRLEGNEVRIGQRIKIDFRLRASSVIGYIVKEGENLAGIAKRFDVDVNNLITINKLGGYNLQKGMVLRLK